MYRKMLLIGLGGSGGKTLRFLKRDLTSWLESRGWTDGVPDGWQFLHIDSPPVPDGLEAGGMPLERQEYLGLVSPEMMLRPVISNLDGVPGSELELTGWRVEPDDVRVPIATGAGQYRSVGRSIGLAFSGAIRDGLEQSIGRMNAAGAQATLDRLYQHVHGGSEGTSATVPIPIVISSLAGGTGAGLILDVLDLLRALEPAWADQAMGLWYTPDVFPKSAGDGVHPNSLAAISEVLNGAWWGANAEATDRRDPATIPVKDSRIMATLARTERALSRSGAHCNFLIGGTNARGATIGTDGRLFEMVGGALLSWVTDLKVQQTFVAYQVANWTQLATSNIESRDVVTNQGSAGERGLPAFSALGFSRVSVGSRYLRMYAARRIAKETARHLAEAHVQGDRAKAEARNLNLSSPDRLVERLVELQMPLFRRGVDVTGAGKELANTDWELHTVIEAALLPEQFYDWSRDLQRWIASQVDNGEQLTADEWITRITPAMREAQRQLEQDVEAALPRILDEWVSQASMRIPVAVEETAGEHGLRVAAGLLEALAGELRSRTAGPVVELRRMTADYQTWASRDQVVSEMRRVLDAVGPRSKIEGNTEMVTNAIEGGLRFARCSAQAMVAERAALLLERLGEGLLRPLSEALRESVAELESGAALLDRWPDWSEGLPPQDVLPPRSEFTVIEPSEFASTFDSLMSQTYPGAGDMEGRRDVRSDVAAGRSVRRMLEPLGRQASERPSLEELTMLRIEQPWLPGFEVTGGSTAARSAIVDARCRPTELERRADHWLMRNGFPFEGLLSVDLRSFTRSPDGTRDDAPEYVDRQARVLEKLDQAIEAAAPLVELQEDLLSLLHPALAGTDNARFTQNLSMVPFRGHPLEQRVRDRMLATAYAGDREREFDVVLTNESDQPHIDIISSLRLPVSPLVVSSLMRPIGEEWSAARADAGRRTSFWQHRRARPLREFIPAPQRHLRCMLRGWFTGRMLGLIAADQAPFTIVLDPQGTQPRLVNFPAEFLSSAAGGVKDQVALVLESMSLAMVEVGRVSSVRPLEAYRALRDYGMSDPRSNDILDYPTLNPLLTDWLMTGNVAGSTAVPQGITVHPRLTGSDEESRRDSLRQLLDAVAKDYADSFAKYLEDVRENRRRLGMTPYWPGIHDEIQVAITGLRRAVERVEAASTGL